MTPEMVTELLRNLYNASGGSVPPTAVASAIAGLMWHEQWQSAWKDAFRASDAVLASGGSDQDVSDAFNNAFADGLGWSREDFDAFLKANDLHDHPTGDGSRNYPESRDLWEWMVNRNR